MFLVPSYFLLTPSPLNDPVVEGLHNPLPNPLRHVGETAHDFLAAERQRSAPEHLTDKGSPDEGGVHSVGIVQRGPDQVGVLLLLLPGLATSRRKNDRTHSSLVGPPVDHHEARRLQLGQDLEHVDLGGVWGQQGRPARRVQVENPGDSSRRWESSIRYVSFAPPDNASQSGSPHVAKEETSWRWSAGHRVCDTNVGDMG